MAEQTPVVEQPLVENQTATPWSKGTQRLETPERERIYWLATVSPDGRPHVRPILGLWLDGAFYFISAETTRKARNLAADPWCAIAPRADAQDSLRPPRCRRDGRGAGSFVQPDPLAVLGTGPGRRTRCAR